MGCGGSKPEKPTFAAWTSDAAPFAGGVKLVTDDGRAIRIGRQRHTFGPQDNGNMWIWFFDAVDAAQATWFVAHKFEGSLVELLLPEEMGTTLPADKATAKWAAGSEIKHGLQVNCMGKLLDAEGSAGARVQLLGYLRSHDPPRWILDADCTLSPSSHPDLVLGWGKMMRQEYNTVSQDTAVLMAKGSENGSVVRLVEVRRVVAVIVNPVVVGL